MDYFKSTNATELKFTLYLDLIIDAVNVVHKENLRAAFKEGISYLSKGMKSR